jgi:hypothetical protein
LLLERLKTALLPTRTLLLLILNPYIAAKCGQIRVTGRP